MRVQLKHLEKKPHLQGALTSPLLSNNSLAPSAGQSKVEDQRVDRSDVAYLGNQRFEVVDIMVEVVCDLLFVVQGHDGPEVLHWLKKGSDSRMQASVLDRGSLTSISSH
ncbi:hypothetical protein KC360_g150 [Hortaea werneckii]|nr:hypothetical protein KC344_g153 [Hortaea werneckii]KAI7180591.1 hypothetical protein KC360_g150 [Hortaea werneckii]